MLSSRKSPLVLAVLAALGAALGGCGSSSAGSDTVTPAAYVTAICKSVGPFETDIATRSSALNSVSINNPAQGKQALEAFLNAASRDTNRAVSQLKAAGSPNVANGKPLASQIVSVFSRLNQALGLAARQAQNLPTSSTSAFRSAAQRLGGSVRNSMTSIGQGLSGLRSAKLEQAAAKDPACQTIGG